MSLPMLSEKEVQNIAKLARLELSDKEVQVFRAKLGDVLEHIRDLQAVDTTDVKFVRHVPKDAVAFRADRAIPFANRAAILENAPVLLDGCFAIPTVVEHE